VSVVSITDVDDPRLDVFRDIGRPDALTAGGRMVVEGRLVVERLLRHRSVTTEAVLLSEAAREAMEPVVASAGPEVPIWVVPRAFLEPLTGFNLHRGCLAIARRPTPLPQVALVAAAPRRLLVLEGVGNPDNVGGLFRAAHALGAGGALLGPGSGDPWYRKAIRVSCGASLVVPFAHAETWPRALGVLRDRGYLVMALTPRTSARPLAAVAESAIREERPVAVVVGAEGPGLTSEALDAAEVCVRIDIEPAADSLNVVVSAAIALHALR
jgi:tRNA G18 (ribose-2'-O)-methylase SpoU